MNDLDEEHCDLGDNAELILELMTLVLSLSCLKMSSFSCVFLVNSDYSIITKCIDSSQISSISSRSSTMDSITFNTLCTFWHFISIQVVMLFHYVRMVSNDSLQNIYIT